MGRDQVLRMTAGMRQNFANVGLPYAFTDQGLVANTMDAHRVLAWLRLGAMLRRLLPRHRRDVCPMACGAGSHLSTVRTGAEPQKRRTGPSK